MMSLGERIRWARERTGLTQAELAERVDVAAGSRVSEWENDRRQPSAPVLMALPGVLGISGHWLLTGEGERLRAPRAITEETVLRSIQRIIGGEIPPDVIRILADPSASAYLTGERALQMPAIPEPAVPSAIMRRQWLSARIQHHEAPYYLEFEAEEVPGEGEGAGAHPKQGEMARAAEAAPGQEEPGRAGTSTVEEAEEDPSIYEGGYVWGHLAH